MQSPQIALAVAWLTLVPALLPAATYDWVLRHGRVIDGTGNPAVSADVAIQAGRIAAIGHIAGGATRELDVRGLIIAPGFIDVHTHAEDVVDLPLAENFLRMGVTTLVLGNCGGSKLNIGEFFTQLEAKPAAPNIATLIGHNTVRSQVMGGSFQRPPTAPELAQMKTLVGQAMQAGAVGFSTGLIYLPGTFARTEEIIELAKVAAAHDGIYVSHLRHEDTQIFEALDEFFRIAREAHIRAEISHVKLSGQAAWGRPAEVLAAIERARAGGLDITQDQYLYTASSTGISTLIPSADREGGREKFAALLADAAAKARLVATMKEKIRARGHADYAYAVVANYRHDPTLNGLNLPAAAKKSRGSASLDDQIELILDIEARGGAQGIFHGLSEADLQAFAQHPNTMFASDSGVRKFNEGVPHPRGYGNNARVLARYVRELKLLRLEDAVRRMTWLPAATFGLPDRGQIRVGAWADLVVFDPATVQDHATFSEPHHYATGYRLVLVNGVAVVEHDVVTGARPGKPVRHVPRE
jgi:N-acyl-D-amino-acid deacylase